MYFYFIIGDSLTFFFLFCIMRKGKRLGIAHMPFVEYVEDNNEGHINLTDSTELLTKT